MNVDDIKINKKINFADYSETLQNKGRVQIHNFFATDTAEQLHNIVHQHSPWYLAYNEFNNFYESSYEEVKKLPPDVKKQFMDGFYQRARSHFQYVFKQYYITQAIKLGEDSQLNFMEKYVNSAPFLDIMRTLANDKNINWVDTFASAYEPGHFLTRHDDVHQKNDRVLAYTVGMTKDWNPNWGGNLVFYDDDNNITEGFIPRFNTLSVFTIPQQHAVQFVAPFAEKDRVSLLGWANR